MQKKKETKEKEKVKNKTKGKGIKEKRKERKKIEKKKKRGCPSLRLNLVSSEWRDTRVRVLLYSGNNFEQR